MCIYWILPADCRWKSWRQPNVLQRISSHSSRFTQDFLYGLASDKFNLNRRQSWHSENELRHDKTSTLSTVTKSGCLVSFRKEQVVHVHVSWPSLYKYTHGGPITTEHATRKNRPFAAAAAEEEAVLELCWEQVSNQHLREGAKHMLAMLWLELASLVFKRMWAWSLWPPGSIKSI